MPQSMSEFKFACPICGQHLTAHAGASGSQVECPTCYRKIVVPQAPTSSAPKFILTASEAAKPKCFPSAQPSAPGATRSQPARRILTGALLAVGLLAVGLLAFGAVLAGWWRLRKAPDSCREPAGHLKPASPDTALERLPGTHAWTQDIAGAAASATRVSGRILGREFDCERAFLQGGNLTLRQGQRGQPELSVTVSLYARQSEQLAGQTINILTNAGRAPKIILSFKAPGQPPFSQTFTGAYSLKLEFDSVNTGKIPGRIYLAVSDDARSCIAGGFTANIRKPAPPKTTRPNL